MMMTHRVKDDIASATYFRLIDVLLESFPVSLNLDYFDLCKADPLCTTLTASTRLAFDSVSALIRLLIEARVVKADHFTDGLTTFFWNVHLTPEGYRRTSNLLQTTRRSDYVDSRELILAICTDHKSSLGQLSRDQIDGK